jgi:transcription initiation factor IIE alpha subunit
LDIYLSKSKVMKKFFLIFVALLISSASLFAQSKAGKIDTAKHVALYTCSMHPDVVSHEPGKCPTCGMDLTLSGKEKMKAEVSKNYVCPVHSKVVSHNAGKCPKCGKALHLSPKQQMKAEVTKIYTCPMHPEVALDKDGVCPKCGKTLVEKKQTKL